METFSHLPSTSARKSKAPRVLSVQFGDGYSQRAGDGINLQPQTWSLTFAVRSNTVAAAIELFFETEKGFTSFDWTPPGGSSAKFICREWSRSYDDYDVNSITATFDEVFD